MMHVSAAVALAVLATTGTAAPAIPAPDAPMSNDNAVPDFNLTEPFNGMGATNLAAMADFWPLPGYAPQKFWDADYEQPPESDKMIEIMVSSSLYIW